MTVFISAGAAVIAGLFLATAGVLQQRAASKRPEGRGSLIAALVRDRMWLLGIGAAGASYGFQAVALNFGPLALVQPLIVSELLFAVPASVRLRKLRLRPRDWLAVSAIIVGLAVAIVAADPHQGNPLAPFPKWIPALVVVAAVAGAGLLAARRVQGPATASMLALGGAVVMGLQSALFAAVIALLHHGFWPVFLHWQTYLLIVASIGGTLLIQHAFQSGPLAASSPVIDAVLPVTAIGLGIGLFGEHIRTAPLPLALAVTGLIVLIGAIVALDTSPVVRHEQQIEEQDREEHEQE